MRLNVRLNDGTEDVYEDGERGAAAWASHTHKVDSDGALAIKAHLFYALDGRQDQVSVRIADYPPGRWLDVRRTP